MITFVWNPRSRSTGFADHVPPERARHGQNGRAIALGRKAWLFCGSDRGGDRAAFMYTLITTAKLNDLDPQAWLADVLARIGDLPLSRLPELLPWEWARRRDSTAIAA